MLLLGSHVGFNKKTQMLGSLEEAIEYKETAFMFYTGAPQNTTRCELNEDLTKKALDKMKEAGINKDNVIVHAPYIVNLCNETNFDFSVQFLTEEIRRVHNLGLNKIVLHPGSHVGLGTEKGIENIVNGLNKVIESLKDIDDFIILLETMAGKGTEIGRSIDEIKNIINGIKNSEHIGVCLDTCHLNDAGYNMQEFDEYLDIFDKEIGIEKIGCIHINDSKNVISSHKDRHENIGFGTIGFDALINIIYNKRIENIPKILETPFVDREICPYKYEIEMIKNKKFNENLIDEIRTK